ncbi:MAG TPA: alpha/beta hydrolase, partial [Sphingobacteriaceae bacterium]
MKFSVSVLLLFLVTFSLVSRAEERKVRTSDGVDLFLEVKGQGLPCLYVHGGPGSGAYWLEEFSGPMLEEKFRMIYLDQRGVSRSGSPANKDFSLERMLKDFEEVRQALGIKKWIVMGHSFG